MKTFAEYMAQVHTAGLKTSQLSDFLVQQPESGFMLLRLVLMHPSCGSKLCVHDLSSAVKDSMDMRDCRSA